LPSPLILPGVSTDASLCFNRKSIVLGQPSDYPLHAEETAFRVA
jgi:hypothetical protein